MAYLVSLSERAQRDLAPVYGQIDADHSDAALNWYVGDGNKRISWAAAMHVLLALNPSAEATDEEAERYCLSILAGEAASATDVSFWMADRLVSIDTE